jgi:hypothetical protein
VLVLKHVMSVVGECSRVAEARALTSARGAMQVNTSHHFLRHHTSMKISGVS